MWTTSTSLMIARLTGSTLCFHQNFASLWIGDHRTYATSTTTTETSNMISKVRALRAKNPYVLFLKDNYKEINAKYPGLKLVDVTKKVAEAWKSLTDDKKQNYIQKYQDQKTLYEEEKKRLSANDLQALHADEKARKIENRVRKSLHQLPTKKPRTAYALYLSSLDRGEGDLKEFMKGAAQNWAQMTVQEKQKFEDIHQQEKQKYAKALVSWAATNEPARKAASPTKKTPAKRTVKKRTTSSPKTHKDKDTSSASSDDESPTKNKKTIVPKK